MIVLLARACVRIDADRSKNLPLLDVLVHLIRANKTKLNGDEAVVFWSQRNTEGRRDYDIGTTGDKLST